MSCSIQNRIKWKIFFSIIVAWTFSISCVTKSRSDSSSENLIYERNKEITSVLESTYPVIPLRQSNVSDAEKIQTILIKDPQLADLYVHKFSGGKMLNEIFSISEARPSDLPQGVNVKSKENYYRLEMYNYALNLSIIAIVSKREQKVIHLTTYKETQPDVPPHLVELANYIARHDTSVIHAYGENYEDVQPLMPGTKTALNRTKCQRSKHLCVAPTFVKNDKALWAIVDLTDLKVAGIRWTQVGETGMAVTQRTAQNSKVMDCYCDIYNSYEKDGWNFKYTITRSDGLQIFDIAYQGNKIFNQVKLVDWHVSYSKTDGFGYSDAIGCPEFSTAAVLAVEPPYFEAIIENNDTTGFLVGQQYYSEGWPTPCNYNYHQYFEFYRDGRFRPVAGSIGRGCGNNGMYRPVTRISIAGEHNSIQEYKDQKWIPWKQEQWTLQTEQKKFDHDNGWFKILNKNGKGLVLVANTGQLRDGGRGDHAYVYATKHHPKVDEGDTDLPTIGPCCNLDYQQGPEKFINNESIEDAEIVLWYVAQVQNDDTKGKEYCWAESVLKDGVFKPIIYPCYTGPMFKPSL